MFIFIMIGQVWCEEGKPSVFWLPAFYFPQSFLTGVLQTEARKKHVPVDCLFHFCQVIAPGTSLEQAPQEGVYVRGLFLAGARWDGPKYKRFIFSFLAIKTIFFIAVKFIYIRCVSSAFFIGYEGNSY